MIIGPDPNEKFPVNSLGNKLCFIKNVVKNPNIKIGDYTYYNDHTGAEDFESKCISDLYEFSKASLTIGKFTCIDRNALFIVDRAYKKLGGFSSYPFYLFEKGWEEPSQSPWSGEINVGNDVWIGADSIIVPGRTIGDGALIGVNSTVADDVPPYTLVGGSPARPIRKRFSQSVIKELLKIQWWNWDIEKISRNIPHIIRADIKKLVEAT